MSERLCNLFEVCQTPEAPLCPIQETALKHAIWYPGEQICQSKQFQELPWIKKQKQIAALRLKPDIGFFTVRMLESLHVVTINLKGADPDDPDAEAKWFREREEKTAKLSQKRRRRKDVIKKKPEASPLFKFKRPKAK